MRVRAASIAFVITTVLSSWTAEDQPPATAPEVDPLASITVSRIAGADRFEVAVRIAQATRTRADVVYLATGSDFPDALSAGPAAVMEQGVLLLTPTSGLGPVVASELVSLAPKRVVVVGGTLSVPDSIVAEVRGLLGSIPITRVSGVNRYDVSRRLAALAFPRGADTTFVATGAKFPDALSAGPAASWYDSPMLLVDGSATTLDPDTNAAVRGLDPSWVSIVGGTNSVSTGIESALNGIAPGNRFEGPDRYAVSLAVNDGFDGDFGTVYFATGANFPDALAGGVLAGSQGHPMYVIPGTCVPRAVLSRLTAHGTHSVVLLGGPSSLSPEVERLTPC
jgi:putative cell wall-binding protein